MTYPGQTPAAATSDNFGAVPRAPEDPVLELGIAILLIGLNGLFALSELSIVSARKARLKTMADSGRAGAATALRLAEDPGRFLSTVQIGITLVGILAGAFSGAALGDRAHPDPARSGHARARRRAARLRPRDRLPSPISPSWWASSCPSTWR